MRIATFNVNGLRARLDFLLHWLNSRSPDVVGIQELKLEDGHFPYEAFQKAGYRAVVHGQKSWNGVAILAREEPVVTQCGLPGREQQGARLLTATVAGLAFTTVYVPNGKSILHPDFPEKLEWLDALAAHLAKAGGGPRVVCGDFNVVPGPLDSWNEAALHGRIFHTEDERSRVQQVLATGLCDVFRDKHPDAREFSWWDYRAGAFHRGHGLRIDLLLATPDATARVKSVEIDREYRKKKEGLIASDHAPVFADLA